MSDSNGLSDRELDVLRLVATGASNKQIAQDLSISQNTVKVHIRNIFSKTGSASRTEAAIYAIQSGLVDPSSVPAEPGLVQAEDRSRVPAWQKLPVWLRISLAGLGLLVTVLFLGLAVYLVRSSPNLGAGSGLSAAPATLARWYERAQLGTARTGLAIAAYEDKIYAIGGEASGGIIGDVESYDLDADTWEAIGEKPTPVRDVSAVVIGGRIFIPGGLKADGRPSAQLEIYNPSQNEWEDGSPLPLGISAYAAEAFEGKLYLFGGWDGENYLDSVYRYDPDNDTWEAMTPMSTARGFAGAAEAGGRIYVMGGRDETGPLRLNEEYTPESDALGADPWEEASPLPDGRYEMGLASIAGIIHMVGGAGGAAEATPYRFYPQGGQWEEFETIGSSPWTGLGLVAVEDDLHAIGGTESGSYSSAHRVYIAIYTTNIPIVQ